MKSDVLSTFAFSSYTVITLGSEGVLEGLFEELEVGLQELEENTDN